MMNRANVNALNTAGPDLVLQSLEQSEDEDEDDLTPLEYARQQCLSRDHLSDTIAFSHLNALQEGLGDNALDDSHLPQLDLGPATQLGERLTLTREAARLLQDVNQDSTSNMVESLVLSSLDVQKTRSLHVELPLLKSDHGSDCKQFALWEGFEVKLQDIKLPLERIEESDGEGLSFPRRYTDLGSKMIEDIKIEKLGVSRDAVSFLQEAIKVCWTRNDEEMFWAKEQKYKRTKAFEPVTPPLLPMSPPPQLFEPSSSDPAFQIPLLPETGDDVFKADLDLIEKDLFADDVPTPLRNSKYQNQDSSSSNTITDQPLDEICMPYIATGTTPPASVERLKSEKYKVEDILTPPMPKVRFSQTIEFVQAMLLEDLPQLNSDEIKDTLQRNFGDAYEKVTQLVTQEQLEQKDVTARVKVPYISDEMPDPPWKQLKQCRDPDQLLQLQKEMMRVTIGTELQTWKKLHQTELKWSPFPHSIARVDFQEPALSGDKTWESFIETGDGVMSSSDMTWKPPGLRILNIDEDDDDLIKPAEVPENYFRQDLLSLVRKRKLELDLKEQGQESIDTPPQQKQARQGPNRGFSAGLIKRRKTPTPIIVMPTADTREKNNLPEPSMLLGEEFSALDMIGNFKELRGDKKPKLNNPTSKPSPPVQTSHLSNIVSQDYTLPVRQSPVLKLPLPAPPLKPPETEIHVIVSTTLLKHRALIRHLEKSLPSIKLVERDFQAHNTSAWLPGSVTRSPITSPLDSEADIIISSKTGIILTTLQKIKQQLLPGTKGKTLIQERLSRASPRYDKLVVLVTEGRPDEVTNCLDENDCNALSGITAFVSGLPSSFVIQFVAGGEETLAKWIASTIVSYRPSEGDGILLEDETHWELFLRRAGMNAYAAQQTIAHLKAPEDVDATSPSKEGIYGLTGFVEMAREERLRRFGALCGVRVIKRVSNVVDKRWM